MTMIVAGNLSDDRNRFMQSARGKGDIVTKITEICKKTGNLIKLSKLSTKLYGLPFDKGFRILATQDKKDELIVKIQAHASLTDEIQYETMLFISYSVKKILRSKKEIRDLLMGLKTGIFYTKDFALLNIQMELSSLGRRNVGFLLTSIFKTMESLKGFNDLSNLYSKSKDELENMYQSKDSMELIEVTNLLNTKIPQFGIKNAFRATETLTYFSQSSFERLISYISRPENALVLLLGDLSASTSNQTTDIIDALSKPVTAKRQDSYPFKISGSGSIVLDKSSDLTNSSYYYTTIPEDKFADLTKTNTMSFVVLDVNPYAVNPSQPASMAVQFDTVCESCYVNTRPDDNGKLYVRHLIDVDSMDAGKLNALRHMLAFKLRWLHDHIDEYQGSVAVDYDGHSIVVDIYCHTQVADRLVSDIVDILKLQTISEEDKSSCKQSYRMSALSDSEFSIRSLMAKASIILQGRGPVLAKDADIMQCDKTTELKLTTKSVYFEGNVDKTSAKKLSEILLKAFPK